MIPTLLLRQSRVSSFQGICALDGRLKRFAPPLPCSLRPSWKLLVGASGRLPPRIRVCRCQTRRSSHAGNSGQTSKASEPMPALNKASRRLAGRNRLA